MLTLVKASRDAGRDVLVHVNGRLRVVIQCKNLENRFPQSSLLEELVKFVLYDYTERYIPKSGITYEFWVPGGLTGPAGRWLAEFPHSLTDEELHEAFDHVVLANKTLGSLDWTEVGAYLKGDTYTPHSPRPARGHFHQPQSMGGARPTCMSTFSRSPSPRRSIKLPT